MTTFRDEFPDFDPATMPAVPAEWSDISWHNDACPSFDAGNDMVVFVDYADQSLREFPDSERFTVSDGDFLLATNDWSEVLAFCANVKDTICTP